MMSSSLEVKIHNILTDYDVPFEEEYEFDDLIASSGRHLRFDFAIFNDDGTLDFLIEAQGRQHYQAVKKFGGLKGNRKQQYNDSKKVDYCLKHKIKIVFIRYDEENQLSYDYIMKKAGY